jgi:hypothetical protein
MFGNTPDEHSTAPALGISARRLAATASPKVVATELWVTLVATTAIAMAFTVLLAWPSADLKPAKRVAFDLDEETPISVGAAPHH